MTEQVRRATRLVEIEHRLRKNPQGLTVRQLADGLSYSPRTIQRDLNVLESELGVPLIDAPGRRWRLLPGSSPVGAVRLTLHEARAIYLATRLFLRHADERDPDGISALDKLADALPPALGRHVHAAAAELRERPADDRQVRVMRVLTECWADSHTVSMEYRSHSSGATRTLLLDPYLLEAVASGAATYVIGFSHEHGENRTFRLERILSASRTEETFPPPDLDDLLARMGRSWGVVYGDDQYDVTVDFSAEVADRLAETHWHPSQRLTPLDGGRVRFEAQLPSLMEFVPWVRSWGHAAVVVGPPELREEVARSLREAADQYAQG